MAKKFLKYMPKSKNRKNHKQKLEARRKRINETTNIKKKQLTNWLQAMQQNILNQQNQSVPQEIENVTDIVETPEVKPELGASGNL